MDFEDVDWVVMGVLPWWRMLARLAILPDGDREVGEMGGLGMVVVVVVVRGWVRVFGLS